MPAIIPPKTLACILNLSVARILNVSEFILTSSASILIAFDASILISPSLVLRSPLALSIISVSYTHLTLPTNREV